MSNLSSETHLTKRVASLARVILLLVVSLLIAPEVSLVFMGILARINSSERIGRPLLAITIIGFLVLFNATKHIAGDWSWYVADYQTFSQTGLFDYLQSGELSIRITEPIYYAFSFVISGLSGGSIFALTLGVSVAVYFTYLIALEKLLRMYSLRQKAATVCIVFALLAGITFTQSTHLVRQYIAGSILFLYFVFIVEGKYKKALLLFVLGALTHNSFLLPASLITICAYLWRQSWVRRHYLWAVILMLISGYGAGSLLAEIVMSTALSNSAMLNDGSISGSVILIDCLLFLTSLAGVIFIRRRRVLFNAKGSAIAVLFIAALGGMLFGGRDLTLFLLRFYFYLEWFRVIGIITVVWFFVYWGKFENPVLFFLPLAFLVLGLRIDQSHWDYGGGLVDHLFGSISWWVEHLNDTRVWME